MTKYPSKWSINKHSHKHHTTSA